MTDNEIVKGLECIASDKDVLCKYCSYNKYYLTKCHKENAKDAIDHINCQKEEIERLETNLKEAFAEIEELKRINLHCESEAVKKFAERLKDYYIKDKRYDRPNAHTMISFLFDKIDNLVKETVGEG